MKKPVVVILLIVILLAALGGGWWWYQSSRQQPLTLYGNVDIRTVNMSFRVGGRLASLTVTKATASAPGKLSASLTARRMKMPCCRPRPMSPPPRRSMT